MTHLLWECMSLCAGARCIPVDRASPGRRHPPARRWTPCSWPAGAGSAPRAPRSAPRWRRWRRRWPRWRGWWGAAVAGTGFPPPPRPGPTEYGEHGIFHNAKPKRKKDLYVVYHQKNGMQPGLGGREGDSPPPPHTHSIYTTV